MLHHHHHLVFMVALIGDARLFIPQSDTIEPLLPTILDYINASLGVNGSLIRSLTTTISGSFSQTHLSSKISGIISFVQLPSGIISGSVTTEQVLLS